MTGTVATNPAPSKPSNGARKADADGCVKSSPEYLECKQSKSPIGKKNPPLTPRQRDHARQQQFQEIVQWRSKDVNLRPLTYDPSLEVTAQKFADELANTPGDKI